MNPQFLLLCNLQFDKAKLFIGIVKPFVCAVCYFYVPLKYYNGVYFHVIAAMLQKNAEWNVFIFSSKMMQHHWIKPFASPKQQQNIQSFQNMGNLTISAFCFVLK